MPQLDKLTFFNQVVSVIVIFFAFYIIILHYILPEIAKVLKTRKYILSAYSEYLELYQNQRSKLEARINKHIGKSLRLSSNALTKSFSFSLAWFSTSFGAINNTNQFFTDAHKAYVTRLAIYDRQMHEFAVSLANQSE